MIVLLKNLFTLPLIFLAFVISFGSLSAHEGDKHDEQQPQVTSRVLGHISFPTTTNSPQAQAAFIEGMLLLHLFEYPYAAEKFQEAQQLDPDFAMAYWGEAMTHNHPIWDEQDSVAALAVVNRLGPSSEARLSKTTSQKEKDYLVAMDVLYGDGSKAERDQAYMFHMQRMAKNYPDDHEVQLFYALSIFGSTAGVRDIPAYMQSTAISQSVFYANRNHPGAAHYLIHGVDDPVHAPLGLEAARALAVMAPDAGHSQHMTSHIFTAVGMWNDVIVANKAAVLVQNRMRVSHGQPVRHWGHYNTWLLYGLLQQGKNTEASDLLKSAYNDIKKPDVVPTEPLDLGTDSTPIASVVQMWARYMIETRGKDREIAAWKFNMGGAFDPLITFNYVHAMDKARSGHAESAGRYLQEFRKFKDALETAIVEKERQAPTELLYLQRLTVQDYEIQALMASAGQNTDQALELAREASRLEGEMPYSFGPPFVDLPSAELLGDLLLSSGAYEKAAAAYKLQLERTRLKSLPLLGLAEAEEKRGNQAQADNARDILKGIWRDADAEVKDRLSNTVMESE